MQYVEGYTEAETRGTKAGFRPPRAVMCQCGALATAQTVSQPMAL